MIEGRIGDDIKEGKEGSKGRKGAKEMKWKVLND